MSTDIPTNIPDTSENSHYRGMTCRELAKAIFAGGAPEQIIRQLPAQTLYMVAKLNGLASSSDLVESALLEQCRLMLDFDIWKGDEIDEESLWTWLGLTEEENSLELLQKVLKCIDLKVIAVLIGRYVDVKVLEEPTDLPPMANYHTPDRGFTWVGIKCEDSHNYFLLARLLALIFETNAELYYQLLSTTSVATESMLIEESFTDRTKRLAAEGVPEAELAAEVNAPLTLPEVLAAFDKRSSAATIEGIRPIDPLLFESRATKHLASLIDQVADKDQIAAEFTYILNAAVVHFSVDFTEQERVFQLSAKVKAAINIGIEIVIEQRTTTLVDLHSILGLQRLYRLGLTYIRHVGKKAQRLSTDDLKLLQSDTVLFSIIACLREPFPEMPAFLSDDGSIDDDTLTAGQRPIETLAALRNLESRLPTAPAK